MTYQPLSWLKTEQPSKLPNILKAIQKHNPAYTMDDLENLLIGSFGAKCEDWLYKSAASKIANWLLENMINFGRMQS